MGAPLLICASKPPPTRARTLGRHEPEVELKPQPRQLTDLQPDVRAGTRSQIAPRVSMSAGRADKALALKSYARQIGDKVLLKNAQRIQDRATNQAGRLLKAIPKGSGKNQADLIFTRSGAAHEAGLSRHQKNQAVAVASVPDEQFERAVEGDNPPTVAALAKHGTKPQRSRAMHGRRTIKNSKPMPAASALAPLTAKASC